MGDLCNTAPKGQAAQPATRLMGVLNCTPDSYFDGGLYDTVDKAVARALEMKAQGADIVDIGGESTRPPQVYGGSPPVTEKEELQRVVPVIEALKGQIPLSIDTRHPKVAQAALAAGADWINDVGGLKDPQMQELVAEAGCPVCVMHMQGTPETMQASPHYEEGIVPHLLDWFERKVEELLSCGIAESQIILDPGIGFGKSVDDNYAIIAQLANFKQLGFPILLGASRKIFMGKFLQKKAKELLSATLVINTIALLAQVDVLRVHDVAEHHDARKLVGKVNASTQHSHSDL